MRPTTSKSRGRVALAACVALLGATPCLAWQGQGQGQGSRKEQSAPKIPAPPSGLRARDTAERASGVILKVEKVTAGATPGSTIDRQAKAGREAPTTLRLTINTNAVWRDWARDQGQTKDQGPPGKDARKGANSVATKGEPADSNNLVAIDVGPETRIETRFRAIDDESDDGSKTPEAARGEGKAKKGASASKKEVEFRSTDLKPGLFIDAEFKHIPAQNPASRVRVVRPILPTTGTDSDRPASAK